MKIEFGNEDGCYAVEQWEELSNYVRIVYTDELCDIELPFMKQKDWNTLKNAVDDLYENMEE